jgi:hypothetical protein
MSKWKLFVTDEFTKEICKKILQDRVRNEIVAEEVQLEKQLKLGNRENALI